PARAGAGPREGARPRAEPPKRVEREKAATPRPPEPKPHTRRVAKVEPPPVPAPVVIVKEPPKPVVPEQPKPTVIAKGELVLLIRPWAKVEVDGREVGVTPLNEPLMLAAGDHKVRLINPDLQKDVTRTVHITASGRE